MTLVINASQGRRMESARELSPSFSNATLPFSLERHPVARPGTLVLQVDATLSRIDGLSWLAERRDTACRARLARLEQEAARQAWSWSELAQARLKVLRPRRSEINELGAAYVASFMPGAADTVVRLRRAGLDVLLSSDVAAEALFGVAAALGVGPEELHAPHLRFDAIGAFVGSAIPGSGLADLTDRPATDAPARWFVGARRSATFASRRTDTFVAFTGVVDRDARSDALASVDSFSELATLLLR